MCHGDSYAVYTVVTGRVIKVFLLLVELAQEVTQLCWLDCKLECATFLCDP